MATKLDTQTIKNLKKPGRYTDALAMGLHLWVKDSNKKYWIYRYTMDGKQRNIGLGPYPDVGLADARIKAIEAKKKVVNGIDPKPHKETRIEMEKQKATFSEFAKQFIETKSSEWTNTKHRLQWEFTIEEYANPVIGNLKLDQITTEDILKILSPIWAKKTETATRLRGRIELILAAATTRRLRSGLNPAQWKGHLETVLAKPNKIKKVKHHAALPFDEIPEFMEQLREMGTMAALALEFCILNASRTGEVIGGKRNEVSESVWIIPGERMKAKREHRVPLCERSIQILKISELLDPDSEYLFSRKTKPLSNMAMTMVIRRLKKKVTVHGFRSTFRDWVSERTDHSSEVAEMSLAHAISNKVEAAYRRGDLIDKRRALLTDWENYCKLQGNLITSQSEIEAEGEIYA
ncbi:integrase arm-type DNA-binding domain-containing protein [Polynucleobacter sp. Adler-ghost]|uniref:tyrosine-type recombinase/integrase n=1 Tax=Polynucleobacter sp. Adler-ghost TaxID=2770234 RepID=UPI00203A8AAC|nr:integrase arm-type DNA-binding domain-containing protein [Polynucleobacter sp. Adler-ghost]